MSGYKHEGTMKCEEDPSMTVHSEICSLVYFSNFYVYEDISHLVSAGTPVVNRMYI